MLSLHNGLRRFALRAALEHFKTLMLPMASTGKRPEIRPLRSSPVRFIDRLIKMSTQIMGFFTPCLGGVDTPHTPFYVEKFGPDGIKTAGQRFRQLLAAGSFMSERYEVTTPFNIEEIGQNVWRLIDLLDRDYSNLICAGGETIVQLMDTLPPVMRSTPGAQGYDSDLLTPLAMADINFSRTVLAKNPCTHNTGRLLLKLSRYFLDDTV